ncbi:MAG: sulfatase-like hydrolase/transferase [Firmicutes bacterium]|nr:sulfatase-like hydrolase/transferase [Bacillota bacterium]
MEKEPSLEQEETDVFADGEASEKKKITTRERVETAWRSLRTEHNRPLFLNALFFACSFFFMECVLKVYVYGTLFDFGLLITALFSASFGVLCGVITALFKEKAGRIIGFVLLFLPGFWIMVQTVYHTIFSAFFTLYSLSGAGDAAEFWQAAVSGILDALLPLVLVLLPFVFFFAWDRYLRVKVRPLKAGFAAMLIAAVLLQGLALGLVHTGDDDVMSRKYLFTKTFIPQLSVQEFGALTTLRLDLKNMIFGMEDTETAAAYEAEEAARLKEERGDYDLNVLDIDFEALAASETDSTYRDMHEYFGAVTPGVQNKYTGMFAGKNLIWICAEGFSSWALNEELTPLLYKMSHECFVFENFYNPIWGVSTSDGEYTTTTGLIPKVGVWSMSASSSNAMPFCMGNQLSAQGYLCNAYHNHSYTYYDRHLSHPNLGYHYIGKGNGLNVKTQWPESDVEMMEKTIDDYIHSDAPFHVYYMTVSGHLEYNFGGNAMSIKHKAEVEDLPYSDPCKAYIACQIELEEALNVLVNRLAAEGKLDDTLIVLSGDHYPYGLTHEQIEELNGSPVDENFELYHSTLIIWNSAMATEGNTVTVDKPCYSVDILPTLSNLMGVDYDSRLLMGRDILSTSSPLVVFSNHSWLTDKGRYNAVTGEFIPEEGVNVNDTYVQNMMDKVNSMFTYSAKILTYDYYDRVVSELDAPEKSNKNEDAPV